MTREIPVDREDEIKDFIEILSGKKEERILLIEAQSGMGKTILLGEFGHHKPKKIAFAKIDFKSGGTSIAELFSRLRDKLGGNAKFPNLGKELKSILNPSIDIKSNLMLGKNQIDAYLSGRDEQEREVRLSALTDALFADIRTFGKLLIIFDTFERSDDFVKKWLADSFLSRVQNSPNIFIVIGGQEVPEDNFEWECIRRPLEGIPPEHWNKYAKSKGMKVHDEYIRACCNIFGGHPLKVKTHLDGYRVGGTK
ncbi:MAG: ATP-binding protein [Anaerolineales bacterium]|nr:ATP-binding protein [Anaerolineales bacterium]